MRKLTTILAAAALGVGGMAYGQYQSEEGINWFGDDTDQAYTTFEKFGENAQDTLETGFFDDESYDAEGVFADDEYSRDDYGYFDKDYDFSVSSDDEDAFLDFFGESDELF